MEEPTKQSPVALKPWWKYSLIDFWAEKNAHIILKVLLPALFVGAFFSYWFAILLVPVALLARPMPMKTAVFYASLALVIGFTFGRSRPDPVTWVSPISTSTRTTADHQEFAGVVNVPGTKLLLNDKEIPVQREQFSLKLPLKYGANTFTVAIHSSKGSVVSESFEVYRVSPQETAAEQRADAEAKELSAEMKRIIGARRCRFWKKIPESERTDFCKDVAALSLESNRPRTAEYICSGIDHVCADPSYAHSDLAAVAAVVSAVE